MRVLWVEDESAFREDIADFLRLEAYEVDEAENGAAALQLLKTSHYDAVLSDILMPKMNGLDLLKACRSDPDAVDNAQVPFIFLTALNNADDQAEARRMGCDDFLTKPIDFSLLQAALKSRIQQKADYQAQQALARAKEVRVLQAVYTHGLLHPAVQLCEIAEYMSQLGDSESAYQKASAMLPYLKEVAMRQLAGIEILRETEALHHSNKELEVFALNDAWLEVLCKQMKRRHCVLSFEIEPSIVQTNIIGSPSCLQRAATYLLESLTDYLHFKHCVLRLSEDEKIVCLEMVDQAYARAELEKFTLTACLQDPALMRRVSHFIGALHFADSVGEKLQGNCYILVESGYIRGVRLVMPHHMAAVLH